MVAGMELYDACGGEKLQSARRRAKNEAQKQNEARGKND
jgi:hypothetical protein